MTRRRRAVAAVLIGIAVAAMPPPASAAPASAAPASAAPAHHHDDPRSLQNGLDRIVDEGAVAAVAEVRDGRRVWRGGSGVVRLGGSEPVATRSRFRAGSITKTFVATVVLQLVAEGRLQLDDPVSRWLPGVVPNGRHITVRELLDQTSGIADYLDTLPLPPDPAFLADRDRTWTGPELIGRATAEPPLSDHPGEAFSYSNTNYLLLGEVVEKVTGRSYAAEIGRRIIRPLRLHGTSLPGTEERIPGPHPHGYVPIATDGGQRLVDYTESNPSVMGAGGEIISTTADLDRFSAALLRGRLLPRRLVTLMTSPGIDGSRYGLGLFLKDTPCHVPVVGHDGDAASYQSWSYSTLDGRRQVTIALTPDFRADLDNAVWGYLDRVFCA